MRREKDGFDNPKRHQMKHLDFDLLLVRDWKVKSSNPVSRGYSFIVPTDAAAMFQSVAWEVADVSRCAVAVPRVAFGSVANPRFLASCSE